MVGWAEMFAGLGLAALQAGLRLVWNFFVCDDAGRRFVCVVLSAHYSVPVFKRQVTWLSILN